MLVAPMTDFPVTVAKLLLIVLSLMLMASAVAAFVSGQPTTGVLFVLLALGVVAVFSLLG